MLEGEESMADFILEAVDLHKSYGDLQAVNGITIRIEQGEIFGLLGPNGAGKTTTISMLTGLLEPTSGNVSVEGMELRPNAYDVKAKIGLVPQELALYPTLSARRNLQFFGRIYGIRGQKLRERVAEVLDLVGLSERADEPISAYSGGMKRRINIAAGLLHKPSILFLDEPTVGVDPQSRNAIFEGIEALNKDGMTILYTTHYMEEAQRLCNRVAIVDEGKIIALDTPSALIASLGGGVIIIGIDGAQSESIIDPISNIDQVKSITGKDGSYVVETRQLQEALMGVLDHTKKINARITSLELLEPNLESVFLQLTGKSLRE